MNNQQEIKHPSTKERKLYADVREGDKGWKPRCSVCCDETYPCPVDNKEVILKISKLIIGVLLIIVATFSNYAVILANDGKMPIKGYEGYESNKHFGYEKDSDIKLPHLADRYPIFNIFIFSIGDFIGIFGLFLVIYVYTGATIKANYGKTKR